MTRHTDTMTGESEKAAKAALVDAIERKILLATKLPAWAGAKSKEEAEQMFYTSLERTGAGILIFICYITWAKKEAISSMITGSGISFRKGRKRG